MTEQHNPAGLTDQVHRVVNEQILPALQQHGGGIEIVDVDESSGRVSVRLEGACKGCPGAQMTMRMGVERHLKQHVPGVSEVVEAARLTLQHNPFLGLVPNTQIARETAEGLDAPPEPPATAPAPAAEAASVSVEGLEEMHRENLFLREQVQVIQQDLHAARFYIRLRRACRAVLCILMIPLMAACIGASVFRAVVRAPGRARRLIARIYRRLASLSDRRRLRLELKHPGITRAAGLDEAAALRHKLRDVPVVPESGGSGLRLNALVPTLDPDLTFGGYLSLLHLLRRLVARDVRVRLLVGDDPALTRDRMIADWGHRPDIRDVLARCDFLNLSSRPTPRVPVHDGDRFLAYSGWMGHVASKLAAHTPFERFAFFIQEYEPIFHANSSTRAVLESAYRLPHVPIFNTSALQHHFQAEGLGIYDPDYREPQRPPALVFEHAICDLSPPSREALERRTVRKLLFYARPERHAERNLFAVGLLALRQALAKGYFPGPWEFHGIGTLIARCRVDLGEGRNLHIVPRVSQAQYEQFVPGFDVGLSLMMAPHPSVLPFEMLSAGMVVVTNTYGHRRKEFFAGISPNLVPCLPEVDSVAEGLRQAAAKATDTDARLRDATVAWNRSWDEAFSPAFIRRLLAAMDGVATPAPAPAADSEDA